MFQGNPQEPGVEEEWSTKMPEQNVALHSRGKHVSETYEQQSESSNKPGKDTPQYC